MKLLRYLAAPAVVLMAHIQGIASGIEGEVILRPVSPVERPGAINHRPYQASISVASEEGRTVAEFQSGPDGRFELNLEPGKYILHPRSESIYPHAPKKTISHLSASFTTAVSAKAGSNKGLQPSLPALAAIYAWKPMPTIRLPQSWFRRMSSLTSHARLVLRGSTVTAE
jgi:hypothetical protein